MFLADGETLTFGEMEPLKKHAISHRARAFKLFVAACLRGTADGAGFGVYVHWPFCASKCPYCDFNSHVRAGGIDEPRFLAAFLRELAHMAALAPGRDVSSIFFGGGTPSLMQPATIGGHPRRHRLPLGHAARRRDYARGQSLERGGRALSRLPQRRRQPRLARRAGSQ